MLEIVTFGVAIENASTGTLTTGQTDQRGQKGENEQSVQGGLKGSWARDQQAQGCCGEDESHFR